MATWGLDLVYAGRTFSFTDEIDVQLTAQFSVFSGTIAEVSEVSLTLDLGIDVPQAVEDGYDLSGATGELTLDSVVVLKGRAIRPVYGDPGEGLGVVRLTLRESVIDDTALIPGPLAKVDSVSWAQHDPNVRQRVYPEIFGAPGADIAGPGSPAYHGDTDPADKQLIIIAGHTVEATQVKMHNITGDYVDTYTVVKAIDGRGQRVSVIDAQETPANLVNEGDELWIEWFSGGGRSGAAGDVLAHMMSQSAVRVDPGRLAAAIQPLNGFQLDFYIDERVQPLEWVADNLLGILPFSLSRDIDGLYPLVYTHSVRATAAIAHLVVGPDCIAASPVTYEGEPLTEFRLEYAPRADTGEHFGVAVATEDDNDFCATARNRYRGDSHDGRYSVDMSTDIVYDAATAERIVATIVERRALRARTVQYSLDRSIHATLIRAGRFVTITDADRAWSQKPAWVTSRTDTSLDMLVTLLVKDELSRELH